MKKLMMALVLCLGVLLSACGGNSNALANPDDTVLVCSMSEESDGMFTEMKATFMFNAEDVATEMDVDMSMRATEDEMKSYWAFVPAMFDEVFSGMETDAVHVETNNDAENYTFTVHIQIDPARISEADAANDFLGLDSGAIGTYQQTKDSLTQSGFVC